MYPQPKDIAQYIFGLGKTSSALLLIKQRWLCIKVLPTSCLLENSIEK